MTNFFEDCAILMVLAATSLAFGLLIWLFLGPAGLTGALLGYVVGFALYLLPSPEF